jgi:hypothetical protein
VETESIIRCSRSSTSQARLFNANRFVLRLVLFELIVNCRTSLRRLFRMSMTPSLAQSQHDHDQSCALKRKNETVSLEPNALPKLVRLSRKIVTSELKKYDLASIRKCG